MHSLLRYQTQAVKYNTHTSTNSGNATTMLPPAVPPVSLYANLPQEWPLARLSVQVRHISVLLRVTGRTLALMQTVVMSFGRNLSLGKPNLPIHHIHVYFPVQFVHKLVARMKTDLLFTEIAPEEGKEYKHNSESETNSPYIVVGTYECPCPSSTFASFPQTPSLAGAYEQGLLDGNLGQMVSFQSTYKSTLRIEVPVWPEVVQAVLPPAQAKCQAAPRRTALQTADPWGQNYAARLTPQTQEGAPIEPAIVNSAEEEAGGGGRHLCGARRTRRFIFQAKPPTQSQRYLRSQMHWQ